MMTDKLIEQLKEGVVLRPKRWSGDTHYDLGGTADEEATDLLMEKAAHRIEELEGERDDYVNRLMQATNTYTEMHLLIEELEAENTRLRDSLDKALERLEASAFTNAEHAQAAEILRAALRNKGTD